MAQHLDRSADRQRRHDRRHQQVGPGAAGTEHAQRRRQHGQVAQGIVARAQPDAAHVAVALAVGIQQRRHADVGRQRQQPDQAHGRRARHAALQLLPDRRAEHADAEQQHAQRLELRRPGPQHHPHAQHPQADGVVAGIAEEIQRVGQQRHRAGAQPGADLHGEHGEVDRQRDPQDLAVAPRAADLLIVIAAVSTHLASPWFRCRLG
ncbi:hypothetical protein D3C78_1119830 [compost metagenome]